MQAEADTKLHSVFPDSGCGCSVAAADCSTFAAGQHVPDSGEWGSGAADDSLDLAA